MRCAELLKSTVHEMGGNADEADGIFDQIARQSHSLGVRKGPQHHSEEIAQGIRRQISKGCRIEREISEGQTRLRGLAQ